MLVGLYIRKNNQMNCYYHPERSAIGICQSCGRGLCSDCATDLEDGLGCVSSCEVQLKKADASKKQHTGRILSSVVSGIAFALLGWWLGFGRWGMPGVLFVFLGMATIMRAMMMTSDEKRFP